MILRLRSGITTQKGYDTNALPLHPMDRQESDEWEDSKRNAHDAQKKDHLPVKTRSILTHSTTATYCVHLAKTNVF